MKKLGTVNIALSFAGCLLGAGYVSGRELWLYFGNYGMNAIPGFLLSIFLIAVMSLMVFYIAGKTGKTTMDEIIFRRDMPRLRGILGVVCELIYYSIVIIMLAGITSLGSQLLGINKYAGGAIAAALLFFVVMKGIGGMVKVFDMIVPVLVCFTLFMCIVRLRSMAPEEILLRGNTEKYAFNSWVTAALNYAALNAFASIGILAPLNEFFREKNTGIKGTLLGSVILTAIALPMIVTMSSSGDVVKDDLPMLSMAEGISPVYGAVYGSLLFMGMFGVAVATMVSIADFGEKKYSAVRNNRKLFLLILTASAYFLSLFGFGNLVASIYPVIGYLGFICFLLVGEHLLYLKRSKK